MNPKRLATTAITLVGVTGALAVVLLTPLRRRPVHRRPSTRSRACRLRAARSSSTRWDPDPLTSALSNRFGRFRLGRHRLAIR